MTILQVKLLLCYAELVDLVYHEVTRYLVAVVQFLSALIANLVVGDGAQVFDARHLQPLD